MKKILKITALALLCITVLLSLVACGNTAASDGNGTCGSGVTWVFDSKTSTLTISGSGKMTDYENPNDLPWAASKTAIKTVVIEDGVEHIGKYVFYGCSALEKIEIPATVVSIGDSAFAFSSKLASVELPEELTSIGVSAFEGCSALESIFVPTKTETIGARAFAYCYSITDAAILAPVELTEKLFINCRSMERLILHPEIEKVAENTFEGCTVNADSAIRSESSTGSVKIIYVYEDGNEAAETYVKEDIAYGGSYSAVSPAIDGYTADKQTVNGKVYAENLEFTVTYTKDEVAVTTAPEEEKNDEFDGSAVVAIVILVAVIAGIAVGAFFIFRSEKKNANTKNSTTVRKNNNQNTGKRK